MGEDEIGGEKGREIREKREREERSSNFSLRYTEIGGSIFVGQRTKIIYLTKATLGYPKLKISPRIQVKSSGNQGFPV